MKKKNGFTLVELLAVIVVLAIIMIIAIPNVLTALNNARRNSFVIEVQKIVKDVKTTYTSDSGLGGKISGPGFYVYQVSKEDLGYDSQGSYEGAVIVDATGKNIDDPQYIVFVKDANYQIGNYNYSDKGAPSADSDAVQTRDETNVFNAEYACGLIAGQSGADCITRNNFKVVYTKTADTTTTTPGAGETPAATTPVTPSTPTE